MKNTGNSCHSGTIPRGLRLLLSCALLTAVVSCQIYGQDQQSQPERHAYGVESVPDAIARVKSGEFAAVHVDLIATANAVEAIPVLKEQFERVQNPLLKTKIAAALVRMKGDKDNAYWDFLVKQAMPVLESDAPDFKGYDSQGKAVSSPSPEFQAWAKTHNVSPDSAAEGSIYMLPGRVLLLGWSRDRRAMPLLRRGLSSPNHTVQIMAALGLAEIGDKDSIPLIIDAGNKMPAEPAATMAEP
jgi:PBS lyase HEAT-like repeat